MTYDERKNQLEAAMRCALLNDVYNEFCFYFGNTPKGNKTFNPIFCGEPREEQLEEVYIGDDDRIWVTTGYKDENHPYDPQTMEYTPFEEFSNGEMVQIMQMCGVPVPPETPEKRQMIIENLALGLLNTDKPLVYAVINTANFDVMGYSFIAMDDSEGLSDLGVEEDDIERADKLAVGETFASKNWPTENAIIIVKVKDAR